MKRLYLVAHLHAVLAEAVVVVGLARRPVGEGDRVLVRPAEQARERQVGQPRPHVTGGWAGNTPKTQVKGHTGFHTENKNKLL